MTDEDTKREGAYGLNVGTYEEGLQYVGRPGAVRSAPVAVNDAMIRQFLAAVRDANPIYWDAELAEKVCGGPIAPPATLVSWVTDFQWQPPSLEAPAPALLTAVPMPGDSMINIVSEIEFFDHIRVGDRLQVVEEVESISEEKVTKVGRGHFLTVTARFHRESGELVAVQRNVMLRFWTKAPR
jgi:acyl dehydratase